MTSVQEGKDAMREWRHLGQEIRRRTVQPFSHVSFVVYFIVAIALLGCAGIWIELVRLYGTQYAASYNGLLTALVTCYLAIIGSTSIRWILQEMGNHDKVLSAIGILILVLMVFSSAAYFLIVAIQNQQPVGSVDVCIAVFCMALSIWWWWMANGGDDIFKQKFQADGASGGDPGSNLGGHLGEIKGDE